MSNLLKTSSDKEKINSFVGEVKWFTFDASLVVPSLSSVQRTMGVPKDERNETELVAKNWESACVIYKNLVKPAGAILPVSDISSMSEKLFENSKSSILYDRFLSSKKAYLFIATIGVLVEERAADLLAQGDYLMGGILDAIASEGVEVVVDLLQDKIARKLECSCVRFSPGYGKWDLSVEPLFIEWLGGRDKGISVNDSFLFTPHKTVSGIIIPKDASDGSPCHVCDTSCCKS